MKAGRFEDFRRLFTAACAAQYAAGREESDRAKAMEPDLWIEPGDLTMELRDALRVLEPFGEGNAEPVFGLRGVRFSDAKPMGAEGQHATWRPTLLSAVDDAMASSSNIDIPIARGWGALDKFRQTLFRKGEKVRVKFCTMDAASYSFWTSFDDVCILGRNPFFPSTSDARGNVHGALGAWCGYGSTEYEVEIR